MRRIGEMMMRRADQFSVMAGLIPAIHVFLTIAKTWMPGMQTSLRRLHKFDCVPGMTAREAGGCA
jgi:hypothetical protein